MALYDPKEDLDAFYGAMADGSLATVDPDDVFDLVDRVAAHPGAALHSLRMTSAGDAPAEEVRRAMLDGYYESVASSVPLDIDGGDMARGFSDIASTSRVAPEDFEAAVALQDDAALDRIMETYYRS